MSDWPPDGAGEPIRLWTVRKDGRVAVCECVKHPIGLEIAVLVGDDLRRTQAFRLATDAQGKADEWRRSFVDYGWTDAPEAGRSH